MPKVTKKWVITKPGLSQARALRKKSCANILTQPRSKFLYLGNGCLPLQPFFHIFYIVLARDDCCMAVNGRESCAFVAIYPLF